MAMRALFTGTALITSLPGYDVNTAPSHGISFDSRWTNLAKVHSVGAAYGLQYVTFPSLGYIPFVEAKMISGSVIYDDRVVGGFGSSGRGMSTALWTVVGNGWLILDGNARPNGNFHWTVAQANSNRGVYVIYRVPVPA